MRSARPPGKSPPAGPRSAGAKSGAHRGPARAASGLRAPSPQLVESFHPRLRRLRDLGGTRSAPRRDLPPSPRTQQRSGPRDGRGARAAPSVAELLVCEPGAGTETQAALPGAPRGCAGRPRGRWRPRIPAAAPRPGVGAHAAALRQVQRRPNGGGADARELGAGLAVFAPPAAAQGNTVRSFRAGAAGMLENKELHIFNLTSLTKSENILSATLYFYIRELINISLSCPVSQECSHHAQRKHIQIDLSAWILKSSGNQSQLLGHLSVDGGKPHRDFVSWLSKDITQLLRKAKENEEFLIGFNITTKGHQLPKKMTPSPEPYILVYANDAAISEPESVVSSLQGHRNFPTGAVPKLDSQSRSAPSIERRRRKRSTGVLLPLQNNELPGAEYQYKEDEVWEERKPYKTLQTQPPDKSKNKKKQRKGPQQKSQTLQFDEQTLKKARRKQWIEPRNCARRYLKVDFADIGWSEWIISPSPSMPITAPERASSPCQSL